MRRRTKFAAGGLDVMHPQRTLQAGNGRIVVPKRIDSRFLCVPTSNQGQSSACAGFTTAGACEVLHWNLTGIPKQFDGFSIYKEAKGPRGDNNSGDGTSLMAAFDAANRLGIPTTATGKPVTSSVITTKRDVQIQLHKHGCCIAGFNITKGWNRTNAKSGLISKSREKVGGHAVLLSYYDDDTIGWQNSWSKTWGWKGFGRMSWKQFDEQFMYALALSF